MIDGNEAGYLLLLIFLVILVGWGLVLMMLRGCGG